MCDMAVNDTPAGVLAVYAAYTTDENIRRESSSGGVFSVLAMHTILNGGVVFGTRFDENLGVVCSHTETIEGLAPFRGSKYVTSRIGSAYKDALGFLKQGRQVLFSGTPCQIAGLRRYIKEEYDNLLTLEVVCHGVPGEDVWQKYLQSLPEKPRLVNFRNKRNGWKNYEVRIDECSVPFSENPYMRAFLSDLSLREACYHCSVKKGLSGADLTLGDFWGIEHIHPEIDDDRGLSLLIVRTDRAAEAIENANLNLSPEKYADALRYNPSIEKSALRPVYRRLFMSTLKSGGFDKALRVVMSDSLFVKIRRCIWLEINRKR